jgi:uncharacterized membrane protein (DUF373 family)
MTPTSSRSHRAAEWLHVAESIVLILIAIVLIALAVMLLGTSAVALFEASLHGEVEQLATQILDRVLLVMMTMEIVYTVAVSLRARRLRAQPFLVIGSIAAIRRMLIITAEGTQAQNNLEAFRTTLLELGLLALIVMAMIVSIYILRRSEQFVTSPEPEEDVE